MIELDVSPIKQLGGVNVIDFNKNPELDKLRHERCEKNFLKL